ncbi:MAG: hypothetical protein LBM59_02985 [Ruminococcus sp.]|jgi:hypothetical protein|nr:hypothetical protein [Ruminococcus sp.]
MKKLLSAILAAALAFGVMAVPAFAAVDDGVKLNKEISENAAAKGSVVELTEFDASRSTDEAVRKEIYMINAEIARTVGSDEWVALNKIGEEDYEGTYEIRSYNFTSDKYLQVIATSIEYPTYGYDPYAYSWVYDRTAEKYVHLSDALIEDGLTECDIIDDAEKLYVPFNEDYLFGGKVLGFYMTDDKTRSYILYMNMVNPAAENWQTLMTYTPGKYTEDGKAVLYQHVALDDKAFTPEIEDVEEHEHDNCIEYGVKYKDEDGCYIRFMRDKFAIVKLGDEFTQWYYTKSEGDIMFNKGSALYEATLENGKTLKVTFEDKEYTLTAAE